MGLASFRIAGRALPRSEASESAAKTIPQAGRQPGRFAMLDRDAAAAISGEWRSLVGRVAEDNIFFDPDFTLPAMTAIGKGVTIATWRTPDGALAALAPVTATRLGRIAPATRIWCHEYGPLGVPLIDRTMIDQAVRGLLEGLMEGGRSLVMPDLTVHRPVAKAIANAARVAGCGIAVIDGHQRAKLKQSPSGGVDCRAALPLRRRKEYSRQMRRLADLGEVAIETASEPEDVRTRFEEFLVLEAAGWKGKRGTALAALPEIAAMTREIVANRAASRTMRIDSIRLDQRPIAMLVSFLEGATAYSWKIAFDEAHARFSPGAQLMLEAGRTLLSIPGIRRIDSCAAADHPMIDHLWRDRLAVGTLVIGPAGGSLLHATGLAAMKAELRGRALARRLVHRVGRLRAARAESD